MPDWKKIVRDRIASLCLEGAAEAELTEELAQFLEERYGELRSGGAGEEEAYRQTIAEVDDLSALRAELSGRRRAPGRDATPDGRAGTGSFLEDFWRARVPQCVSIRQRN
jgi:hypothetical protein